MAKELLMSGVRFHIEYGLVTQGQGFVFDEQQIQTINLDLITGLCVRVTLDLPAKPNTIEFFVGKEKLDGLNDQQQSKVLQTELERVLVDYLDTLGFKDNSFTLDLDDKGYILKLTD